MRNNGLGGPLGPRPTVPHKFWDMSREEIVKTIMDEGFSCKMAEHDADKFLAYRDGPKQEPPSPEEEAGNDSVSEMSIWERLRNAFERGGH